MTRLLATTFLFACVTLAASASYATDYSIGQCPVAPNCTFGANPPKATTFSDTFTFYLGNWTETYGVYEYTSSVDVVMNGGKICISTGGRGSTPACGTATITSATLDGVPMTQVSQIKWEYVGSLSPGDHVMAVAGTVSGATWVGHESGGVQGVQYTLVSSSASSGN